VGTPKPEVIAKESHLINYEYIALVSRKSLLLTSLECIIHYCVQNQEK